MRYVGGKSRIAKWVRDSILSVSADRTHYVEPFVGSGATFALLAPEFPRATARDAHEDLILLWKAIAKGWEPPDYVTREEYQALKIASPSALRGIVGFGASFSGKWFGGYVDTCWDKHHNRETKPYLKTAKDSVMKLRSVFGAAQIEHASFESLRVTAGMLIYCDPPYAGTLGYGGTKFNSDLFWDFADHWADVGACVIVSEADAPFGWTILAERERRAMLRVAHGEDNEVRREVLFWKGAR